MPDLFDLAARALDALGAALAYVLMAALIAAAVLQLGAPKR